jgi:hypothetical protein
MREIPDITEKNNNFVSPFAKKEINNRRIIKIMHNNSGQGRKKLILNYVVFTSKRARRGERERFIGLESQSQ